MLAKYTYRGSHRKPGVFAQLMHQVMGILTNALTPASIRV